MQHMAGRDHTPGARYLRAQPSCDSSGFDPSGCCIRIPRCAALLLAPAGAITGGGVMPGRAARAPAVAECLGGSHFGGARLQARCGAAHSPTLTQRPCPWTCRAPQATRFPACGRLSSLPLAGWDDGERSDTTGASSADGPRSTRSARSCDAVASAPGDAGARDSPRNGLARASRRRPGLGGSWP